MINICANTNFFLEIILHITHVLLVWPALRRGGKGSDLMNGHRVFPGKGGHGFTVPPALALPVCVCVCHSICHSSQAEPHTGCFPRLGFVGSKETPPVFSFFFFIGGNESTLKSKKKMFTCQVRPLLTTPMIYPRSLAPHCSHINVRAPERAGPCLPPSTPDSPLNFTNVSDSGVFYLSPTIYFL